MSKLTTMRPEFVERIPQVMEEGVIYISERFKTGAHNCCCGCGTKIVTPFKPGQWSLRRHGNAISITPSIGNWSSACQSHYWIINNAVDWSHAFTAAQIEANRRSDLAARHKATADRIWAQSGFWSRLWIRAKRFFE